MISRIHIGICGLVVISSLKLQKVLTLGSFRETFAINQVLLEILVVFVFLLLQISSFFILRHIEGRFVVVGCDRGIVYGSSPLLTYKLIWGVQRLQMACVSYFRKRWHKF